MIRWTPWGKDLRKKNKPMKEMRDLTVFLVVNPLTQKFSPRSEVTVPLFPPTEAGAGWW